MRHPPSLSTATMLGRLPVTGRSLGSRVRVVLRDVEALGHGVRRVLKVLERRVEGQTGAHPEEHAGAQAVARGPEVVAAVAGVLQVLGHGLDLLLGLERGQLEAQRAAVLVGEEVVELRRIGIHPADKVLDAIELDGCDALSWRVETGEKRRGISLVTSEGGEGGGRERYVIYRFNYTHDVVIYFN